MHIMFSIGARSHASIQYYSYMYFLILQSVDYSHSIIYGGPRSWMAVWTPGFPQEASTPHVCVNDNNRMPGML